MPTRSSSVKADQPCSAASSSSTRRCTSSMLKSGRTWRVMPLSARRRYSLVAAGQSATTPRRAPAAASAAAMPRCQSRIVPPVSKVSALIAKVVIALSPSEQVERRPGHALEQLPLGAGSRQHADAQHARPAGGPTPPRRRSVRGTWPALRGGLDVAAEEGADLVEIAADHLADLRIVRRHVERGVHQQAALAVGIAPASGR